MFILKTIDKLKFEISDEEAKNALEAIKNQEKGIVVNGSYIMVNQISSIYPEQKADLIEDRKNQIEGVLNDGSRVKRHFGMWVDATNQVPDDKGNYVPVRIDPVYYPEVAMDCVPTPQEWEQKYKQVKSGEELIALMTGKNYEKEKTRLGETEFKKLGDIL